MDQVKIRGTDKQGNVTIKTKKHPKQSVPKKPAPDVERLVPLAEHVTVRGSDGVKRMTREEYAAPTKTVAARNKKQTKKGK